MTTPARPTLHQILNAPGGSASAYRRIRTLEVLREQDDRTAVEFKRRLLSAGLCAIIRCDWTFTDGPRYRMTRAT
jgi:hypothetical protein